MVVMVTVSCLLHTLVATNSTISGLSFGLRRPHAHLKCSAWLCAHTAARRVTPPTEIRYTKEHEWVRVDGKIATVGITDYAQVSSCLFHGRVAALTRSHASLVPLWSTSALAGPSLSGSPALGLFVTGRQHLHAHAPRPHAVVCVHVSHVHNSSVGTVTCTHHICNQLLHLAIVS